MKSVFETIRSQVGFEVWLLTIEQFGFYLGIEFLIIEMFGLLSRFEVWSLMWSDAKEGVGRTLSYGYPSNVMKSVGCFCLNLEYIPYCIYLVLVPTISKVEDQRLLVLSSNLSCLLCLRWMIVVLHLGVVLFWDLRRHY